MGVVGNVAGCEIHFPAGTYLVQPTSSSYIALPPNIPITLSGDGQHVSTLMVAGSPADLFVGPSLTGGSRSSDGFTAHDLGFVHSSGSSTCATFCADIHLPQAQFVTLYNLYFNSANTPIELGRTNASGSDVGFTNISAITSVTTFGCLFRLDGANGTTHIVGITADGNHNVSSQILCLPSADTDGMTQYGTGTLRLSDSTFTAFGRGLSVTAYSLFFKNNYFDNLVINSAEAGPAFELFTAPTPAPGTFPPSVVQDVRISNSRLVSAATACVIHGAVQLVKMVSVSCIGGQAAAVPPGCMAANSQRGYVLAEITGTGLLSATVTLTISSGASHIAITATQSSTGETPQAIASQLGSLINASAAVHGPCPLIIPPEQFSDYLYPTSSIDFSIGADIELYTYQWGTTRTPTFSASSSGGGACSHFPVQGRAHRPQTRCMSALRALAQARDQWHLATSRSMKPWASELRMAPAFMYRAAQRWFLLAVASATWFSLTALESTSTRREHPSRTRRFKRIMSRGTLRRASTSTQRLFSPRAL